MALPWKKSWNVYNQANIERVRRDEAAAKAKEEAEEQLMQEIDAERRMQILRGEKLTPLPPASDRREDDAKSGRPSERGYERRKRKRVGENDTDFEMRIANDNLRSGDSDRQVMLRKSTSDAPLVDHAGHIDLFPQEHPKQSVVKNAEAEKELEKKKREYEDQYTMRFSNAAGFKQGLDNPWYSKATSDQEGISVEPPSKDVWGNEDPRRKEREAARVASNDPLAAMRKGAAKVREVEKERKRYREDKERETQELIRAERHRRKHRKRHRDDKIGVTREREVKDPGMSMEHLAGMIAVDLEILPEIDTGIGIGIAMWINS
ncbi:hypothetical protein F5884DRAFT_903709 [Xylogone sp. PMI_703]|nr:hypothetical protein F5884DRAFT_903709 [Xylogone sp. PMI_703]